MEKLQAEQLEQLQQQLDRNREIVILIHHNPDGDALGAALSLSMYLEQYGHTCEILSPNAFPEFLQWMPGIGNVHRADLEPEWCRKKVEHAGFIFCLDFNQSKRVQELQVPLEKSKAYKALIDHHIAPADMFDFVYSVTEGTSSTCELVYHFIGHYRNDGDKITREMAECLYAGIMTDTGSFSYSCDNPSTHETAGKLIAMHINGERIHRNVYDTYSENRVRLLGFSLSERLHVLPEYATSYIYLTKADLNRFHYQQGDTEGIVNYGLSMKTVRFTAFFSERDGRIRISFRSKGDFDANAFARAHFNGGGHKNAAGGESFDTMEETIGRFLAALPQYPNQLCPPCAGAYAF
jgi:phosphoesterase RecJ-like protein